MKYCWVVTQGSYSDYHVVGVYSTKKLAESFVKSVGARKGEDGYYIEKYPLDPYEKQLNNGLKVFNCEMNREGSFWLVEPAFDYYGYDEIDSFTSMFDIRDKKFVGKIWAKNKTHARKILNEFRVKAIAEGRY